MSISAADEVCPPPTEIVERCPICGSTRSETLLSTYDRQHHLPGWFAYVQCSACRFVWLSPRPVLDRLDFYYPDTDYYTYQAPTSTLDTLTRRGRLTSVRDGIRYSVLQWLGYDVPRLAAWQQTLQPIFVRLLYNQAVYGWGKRFPRFERNGRVLEVGCGNGVFLSYLKHHGWDVVGVDMSAKAAAIAKERFNIDIFAGRIENVTFEAESFDIVVMSHVIEHLPDPGGTLWRVARLLKPHGRLYVETPNYESFGRRCCGLYWFPWEAPRHLCLFAPESLRRVIENSGLTVATMGSNLFPIFRWEDTYRREEREKRTLEDRPRLRFSARPRAAMLTMVAWLNRVVNPLSGDILHCWAEKA